MYVCFLIYNNINNDITNDITNANNNDITNVMSVPDFSDVKTLSRFPLDKDRIQNYHNYVPNDTDNVKIYATASQHNEYTYISQYITGYIIVTGIEQPAVLYKASIFLLVYFKKCKAVIFDGAPNGAYNGDYILKVYPSNGFSFKYKKNNRGEIYKSNIREFNISYKCPFPHNYEQIKFQDVNRLDTAFVHRMYLDHKESEYRPRKTANHIVINDCVSIRNDGQHIFTSTYIKRWMIYVLTRNHLRRITDIIQLLGNN